MTDNTTPRHLHVVPSSTGPRMAPADTRCPEHPAYEADYCPVCGTAREIGK